MNKKHGISRLPTLIYGPPGGLREGTGRYGKAKQDLFAYAAAHYSAEPGVLPGCHMNKSHWVTLLLDGGTEDELMKELLPDEGRRGHDLPHGRFWED